MPRNKVTSTAAVPASDASSPKQRGGARAGAGKKPVHDETALKQFYVGLTQKQIHYIRQFDAPTGETIRTMIDEAIAARKAKEGREP